MDFRRVPEDQKGAVEKGAAIVFVDEVGSSLKPVVARTWARKGHTPTLRHTFNWSSLSIIGGITSGGRVFQNTHEHAIRAEQVIAFLEHLLEHVQGQVVVILDRASIHRAKAVKAFLEKEPRLEVHHLPAYAPECNPIEWLWAHVKRQLANLCPFSPAAQGGVALGVGSGEGAPGTGRLLLPRLGHRQGVSPFHKNQ